MGGHHGRSDFRRRTERAATRHPATNALRHFSAIHRQRYRGVGQHLPTWTKTDARRRPPPVPVTSQSRQALAAMACGGLIRRSNLWPVMGIGASDICRRRGILAEASSNSLRVPKEGAGQAVIPLNMTERHLVNHLSEGGNDNEVERRIVQLVSYRVAFTTAPTAFEPARRPSSFRER